jgi:hypothetical protein
MDLRTPYAVVTSVERPKHVGKRELVRLSRQLEAAAMAAPPQEMAAALQDHRFLTARTREVYRRLASSGAAVTLLARGLQGWLAPGVRGVDLDEDDPLVDEWVVVVHSSTAAGGAGSDRPPTAVRGRPRARLRLRDVLRPGGRRRLRRPARRHPRAERPSGDLRRHLRPEQLDAAQQVAVGQPRVGHLQVDPLDPAEVARHGPDLLGDRRRVADEEGTVGPSIASNCGRVGGAKPRSRRPS